MIKLFIVQGTDRHEDLDWRPLKEQSQIEGIEGVIPPEAIIIKANEVKQQGNQPLFYSRDELLIEHDLPFYDKKLGSFINSTGVQLIKDWKKTVAPNTVNELIDSIRQFNANHTQHKISYCFTDVLFEGETLEVISIELRDNSTLDVLKRVQKIM